MISLMREELGAVLRDPVFARSPALSRLLTYLVGASAQGEGASLKSYTVAVEGLGKSADFDPQINTSARVLVLRLRRALDTYYAGAGAERAVRLYIAAGSYEVTLEDNPHYRVEQEAGEAEPVQESAPARRPWWLKWAALLLLAAIAAGLAMLSLRPAADEAQWNNARFPYVYFEFEDDGTPMARDLLDTIRLASIEEIGRYEVIRPAWQLNNAVNYIIKLRAERGGEGVSVRFMVVDAAFNKIIYTGDLHFADRQDFDRNGLHRIYETYFNLLGYRGVIVSQERKRASLDPGAYGCWLRFSADSLANGGFGDGELDACAANWHSHSPEHPVATAIYAWTVVNSTLGELSDQRRKAKLDDAAAMLELARTLNPDSRHVLLSLARTYAFMGDFQAMQEVSATLEQKGQSNLDILNSVGTLLVLQNDMRGIGLIDHSISGNADPPGRYYVGRFIAAMMSEDLDGARAAVTHINTQNHTSVLSRILQAAYEARAGNLDAARASWEVASEQQPVLRLYPGAFLATMPASPSIKAKLREWLQPAVSGL